MSEEPTFTQTTTVRGKGDPVGNKNDLAPDPAEDLLGFIATEADIRFVRVARFRLDGTKPFLATMPVEQFTLENVRELYGGGAYALALLDAKKRVVPKGHVRLDIDGPEKNGNAPTAAAGPPPPLQQGETELQRMMRELRELREEMRRAPPNVNPIDSAVQMVTAIQTATAPLLEAVLKTKQSDPNEMFLRALRVGIQLADRGGGKADPLDRLMNQVGIPLLDALTKNSGASPEAPAAAGPQAAAAPALPATPGAPLPAWGQLFAPFVPVLCGYADRKKNPVVYAGVVAEELNEAQLDGLFHLFERGEEFRAEFFAAFPAAAEGERREWFNGLMNELHEGLKAGADELEDDAEQ